MKLKKIRLAGFKSFVDPTTIQLQSNLTGIVGPNGCGKSNIIDAVRWVMGEISAKQLRGESMTDVIFNGSSVRKPVGQASVELIFDNSDASLGGEYAQYNEIAIRREVDRNGFSDYFLNNAKCRRKDITDIFLGTGLGPRSYAIIEQGMISKLIDAKPDELRIYIEEAAGISKYKERRRETENRIKHTKENLNRLNDIREELDKQLRHLKSQANAAERYKKLREEERLTKAQLHALHWQEVTQKLQTQATAISDAELQLENKSLEQNALEAKIAQLRTEHIEDTDKFNEIQSNYYSVGANIGRIEQQIQHTKERQQQLSKDLTQLNQVWQETVTHQTTDQNQLIALNTEQAQLTSEVTVVNERATKAQQELQLVELAMQSWQQEWDQFNSQAAQILQRLEVEQTRMQHLEQRLNQENTTLEKLQHELNNLDYVAIAAETAQLTAKFDELKANHETLHNNLANKQQEITAVRAINTELAQELAQTRNRLQNLTGRKASLEALQQTALGKNDAVLGDWLKQQDLDSKPRLAQELQVVPGWETAVETVLGSYLEAVCVDNLDGIINTVKSLTHGNLIAIDTNIIPLIVPTAQGTTLLSKVNSKLPITNLLAGIYAAENLAEAIALRDKLAANESIVTKDGVWLSRNWLRVSYGQSEKSGILQRERELQELQLQLAQEQNRCETQEDQLQHQQTKLAELERAHHELQQQIRILINEYTEVQGKVSAKQTHLNHLREREGKLAQDIKQHENNLQIAKEQLANAQTSWSEATSQKASDERERQHLSSKKEELQEAVAKAREQAAQEQQTAAHVAMRLQLLQTQSEYLKQNLERATQRLESLREHKANIEQALTEAQAPLVAIEQELQQELVARNQIEGELTAAKQKVTALEHTLRELEQERQILQKGMEQVRGVLEGLRTERQGLQVRSTTYQEQIAELEQQLETVLTTITEGANIVEWEQKIAHLATRIERLGPINLAAISEYEQTLERKNYLDAQNQDLINALNTLESAIRKIDVDTKEKFKEAYNNINQRLQELFPKIFNGGRAYLEQTADDWLETGVILMAQPPGKRNSSIHLLSGGEKALTAIALIFAIFELNPAPFCMLDEVDAPLDDLNVSRFCNLVKEMAHAIQFIFITHNKLTMEIAGQLAGVTMQEAGVSRIVSVDIDAAVQLAGADK